MCLTLCEHSMSSTLFLTTVPGGRCSDYPHFIEEETGSERLSIEAKNVDVIFNSSVFLPPLIQFINMFCQLLISKYIQKSDRFSP